METFSVTSNSKHLLLAMWDEMVGLGMDTQTKVSRTFVNGDKYIWYRKKEDNICVGESPYDPSKEIYTLPQDYNKVIELCKKPEWVEGDWVFIDRIEGQKPALVVANSIDYRTYGFNFANNWTTDFNFKTQLIEEEKIWKATDKEVGEALINLGEEKGFDVGVTINNSNLGWHNHSQQLKEYGPTKWKYDFIGDTLDFHGCEIYKKGVWATIVKDTVVEVNGHKAEYRFDLVALGCADVLKPNFKRLNKGAKKFQSVCGKWKVSKITFSNGVEDATMTMEQIDQILKGFKK